MGISATGIGSNLDVEGIITKLMTAEKQPLNNLANKEASYQAQLTAFGTLKSALSQFQSAVKGLSDSSKFQSTKASIADSAIGTISATGSASPGTYALEVTQLAQAQKLAAAGQASENTKIGKGVITFDFGTISGGTLDSATGKYSGATFTSNASGVKTITIDDSNNTLDGIRDAINAADIGVTASIVNDGGDSPYRLVLSMDDSGKANSLKISVADAAGAGSGLSDLLSQDPAGSQSMTQTVAAQNAEFKLDGLAVSKSSNTVTDAITGVTLNLAKTNAGSTTNITVSRDTSSVTSAVNSFVSSYNSIMKTLKDASAYDPETKSAAILNGESSVRVIQTQLRGVLTKAISGGAGSYSMLSQIGVSLNKDGMLSVDNTKLQKALDTHFNDVASLFAASGSPTDSQITYSGSTANTKAGSYGVVVTQLATNGKTTAGSSAGLTITKGVNDTVEVKLDGKLATITLNPGTYKDAAALATELQSKINGVDDFTKNESSVKVTASGGALTLTSDRYGSASNIKISGGNGQANLGFGDVNLNTVTDGVDVAGTINGVKAGGSGQTLTGATTDASEGIKIKITGGSVGVRGTINFSRGYADQFTTLADSLLSDDGPITSRTDGINSSLKSLSKQEDRITKQLEATEKRYRAQFAALDNLMSSMSSTSSFLSQYLG